MSIDAGEENPLLSVGLRFRKSISRTTSTFDT